MKLIKWIYALTLELEIYCAHLLFAHFRIGHVGYERAYRSNWSACTIYRATARRVQIFLLFYNLFARFIQSTAYTLHTYSMLKLIRQFGEDILINFVQLIIFGNSQIFCFYQRFESFEFFYFIFFSFFFFFLFSRRLCRTHTHIKHISITT